MRRPLRATLALSLLTLLALSAPAVAAPDTVEIVVEAKVVFEHGANPERPGNCSALVFAQWKHVDNTLAAEAVYVLNGIKRDEGVGRTPPYDDRYDWVRKYEAPRGSHRIVIGKTWRDGGTPNDCTEFNEKHKEMFSSQARVRLTIENEKDTKKCAEALEELGKANKAVIRVRRKLRNASESEKPALLEKLREAKRRRAQAAAKVGRLC